MLHIKDCIPIFTMYKATIFEYGRRHIKTQI